MAALSALGQPVRQNQPSDSTFSFRDRTDLNSAAATTNKRAATRTKRELSDAREREGDRERERKRERERALKKSTKP